MVYRGYSEKRHERDRAQWSDTFKQQFDVIVKGRGEGLIEGVYFGAAYDTPPFFEFSAVRGDVGSELPEMHQGVWAHPNQVVSQPQQFANTVASNIHSGWFPDGGFEVQGQWDSTIPDYSQNHTYDDYWQVVYEDIYGSGFPSNYPADNGYALQGGNSWVQEPKNPRWTVTSEKANPNTPRGPKSKYSAKYTFTSTDDVSPRLIPFYGPGQYAFWSYPKNDAVRHLAFASHLMPVNVARGPGHPLDGWTGGKYWWGGGGYNYTYHTNPTITAFEYEIWAYSDQACTLVADSWCFDADGPAESIGYPVPDDTRFDVYNGWSWVPESEAHETFELAPGEWNKFRWNIEVPARMFPGLPWPTWSNGEEPYSWGWGMRFASLNLRVKDGQPGQSVYLDDLEGWYKYEPWEDPFITVGVSKWIRDEAGAYVGADLWVKVSNFVPFAGECGAEL